MIDAISWLPFYSIRRSLRAKRISIRIDQQRGVELVLPKSTTVKHGLAFLESQRTWIERHAAAIINQPKQTNLPETVTLHFLQSDYLINYRHEPDRKRAILREINGMLMLRGASDEAAHYTLLFKRWLKQKAQSALTIYLEELSQECKLPFTSILYRMQKTVWGSCSSKQQISLNIKLLFLPKALVRYVLIHELCHTRHLNHSQAFWQLVQSYEPQYKKLRRALKYADQYIPNWLV